MANVVEKSYWLILSPSAFGSQVFVFSSEDKALDHRDARPTGTLCPPPIKLTQPNLIRWFEPQVDKAAWMSTPPIPPTSPAKPKAAIHKSELKFDTSTCRYVELPEEPERGTVVCFDVDRAPLWDMFVVIEACGTKLKAIRPRIRATKLADGSYDFELGQDRETSAAPPRVECTCAPVHQGDDFRCRCGAYEENSRRYQHTFEAQGEYAAYTLIEVDHINMRQRVGFAPWLEVVKPNRVNDLDTQDGPHCC